MRYIILVLAVIFAANISSGSAGRLWDGIKAGLRRYWKDNKDKLIQDGIKILLQGRDVDSMDLNGDGALDSSELSLHLDARDVDEMMSTLGKEKVTEEDMRRFIDDLVMDA